MSKIKKIPNRIDFHFINLDKQTLLYDHKRGFATSCWDKYFQRRNNNKAIKCELTLVFFGNENKEIKIEDLDTLSTYIDKFSDILKYEENKVLGAGYKFTFKSLMGRMYFMRIVRSYMLKVGFKVLNKTLTYHQLSKKNIYESLYVVNCYYDIIEYNILNIREIKNNYKALFPMAFYNTFNYYKKIISNQVGGSTTFTLPLTRRRNKKEWINLLNSNIVNHSVPLHQTNSISPTKVFGKNASVDNSTIKATDVIKRNLIVEIEKFKNVDKSDICGFSKKLNSFNKFVEKQII
tara:strand:- start:56655 stop:57530 length:876 start_codon:yes stop_codon:yes gene_type:complete